MSIAVQLSHGMHGQGEKQPPSQNPPSFPHRLHPWKASSELEGCGRDPRTHEGFFPILESSGMLEIEAGRALRTFSPARPRPCEDLCPNRSHAGVCNKLGTKAGSEMARARTLFNRRGKPSGTIRNQADAKDAECKRTLFPPAFQKWLGTLLRLNKLKVPSRLVEVQPALQRGRGPVPNLTRLAM